MSVKLRRLNMEYERLSSLLRREGRSVERFMPDGIRMIIIHYVIDNELELNDPADIARELMIEGRMGFIGCPDITLVRALRDAINCRFFPGADDAICPDVVNAVLNLMEGVGLVN